jgi:exodeoxyribonuclease-3
MRKVRILSWNVNGIRAVHRKGFRDWLLEDKPDFYVFKRLKLSENNFPRILGVLMTIICICLKQNAKDTVAWPLTPIKSRKKLDRIGIPKFDSEGRTLITDYGDFVLLTSTFQR